MRKENKSHSFWYWLESTNNFRACNECDFGYIKFVMPEFWTVQIEMSSKQRIIWVLAEMMDRNAHGMDKRLNNITLGNHI